MALEKVQITVKHTGERIAAMFNPEEYTLNQDNNFASQSVPGLSSPLLQFVNGNLRTLEMELLFDTYLPHTTQATPIRDVREETQRIIKLMEIDSELHAPPVLEVSWASLTMECVLARVGQKFIMFLPDGRPVRARLTVHRPRARGEQDQAPDGRFQQGARGGSGRDLERDRRSTRTRSFGGRSPSSTASTTRAESSRGSAASSVLALRGPE